MRIFALSSRALILIALTAGSAAQAAERISMPFNCQFDGERVQMYPSEERSYEIFGRRESEVYTACSPADPNRCRSWHMHRFDFSCSGVRVPWIDAAAAGARASGREAWVEGGSFHLVMGPMWTSARPYFGRGGWWRHRYPRDDYGADDGARVVTLPPGYAPALGIPVTFTGTPSSEVAQAPFPPATVTRAPALKEKVPPLPERAPRKQETQPAVAPAVTAKPSAEPAPATAPTSAPTPPTTVAEAPAPAAPVTSESKRPAPTVSIPGSVTPTLINGAGAATAAATPASPAPEFKTEVKVASETAPAAETTLKDASGTPPASAPAETASLPAPATYDQKMLVMLAGAAAALLTITSAMAAGLWRWSRGPKRLPPPATHDIASISLDGAPKGTSLSIHAAAPAPAVQAPPPLLPGSAGFGRPDDVPMPTTYAEALEVLGAAPDASLEAIKKIVDGMRQSWHPDLARTEFDRRVRLRRMQQVNVAWDLVSLHRSAA